MCKHFNHYFAIFMESLDNGIYFPVNRYIHTWLSYLTLHYIILHYIILYFNYKVIVLTESIVTVMYTWEEYVGNQNNLFQL